MSIIARDETWGIRLPITEKCRGYWGARAIYSHGRIDIPWDRCGFAGELTAEERRAMVAWINDRALPYLRGIGSELPGPDENFDFEIRGDGFRLICNPKGSYGYLFISVVVDPTAGRPTPRLGPVNDARTRCKHCGAWPTSRHSSACPSAARVASRQAKTGVRDPDRPANSKRKLRAYGY